VKAGRILGALFCVLFLAAGVKAEQQEGGGLDALFSAAMLDIHGEPMTLAEFRGKPLIVNFWARWCVPCRDEIPELVTFQAQHQKQGLVILGIALEDEPGKVRDFLAAYEVNYPVALVGDAGLALMQALGNDVMGLPFTLFIDRNGEIVWVRRGVLKKSDLQNMVNKLL